MSPQSPAPEALNPHLRRVTVWSVYLRKSRRARKIRLNQCVDASVDFREIVAACRLLRNLIPSKYHTLQMEVDYDKRHPQSPANSLSEHGRLRVQLSCEISGREFYKDLAAAVNKG